MNAYTCVFLSTKQPERKSSSEHCNGFFTLKPAYWTYSSAITFILLWVSQMELSCWVCAWAPGSVTQGNRLWGYSGHSVEITSLHLPGNASGSWSKRCTKRLRTAKFMGGILSLYFLVPSSSKYSILFQLVEFNINQAIERLTWGAKYSHWKGFSKRCTVLCHFISNKDLVISTTLHLKKKIKSTRSQLNLKTS